MFEALAQILADLALDLAGMFDHAVQRAVLIDPLRSSLRAHFGSARGNVVDGVAHQRQIVDDAFRRHAVLGHHAVAIQRRLRHRVHQRDVLRHQLRHIFVAGGDDDAPRGTRSLGRERADHVVRFHIRHPQQRHAHGRYDVEDGLDLHAQVVRHARPVGLVFGEQGVAEGRAASVEYHGHRAALEVVGELAQHADDAADGAGWEPVESAQVRQGVKSSEEVGRTVYEQ